MEKHVGIGGSRSVHVDYISGEHLLLVIVIQVIIEEAFVDDGRILLNLFEEAEYVLAAIA